VAAVALLVVPLGGSTARAADAQASPNAQSVAELRAQADAIASRYFDALARYQALDRQIDENRHQVAVLAARARKARARARARALSAYRTSTVRLTTIIASDDALAFARRSRLVDEVNHRDQNVFNSLRAATRRLDSTRRELESDRQQQADALADLRNQSAVMDAKLALAQQLAQVEAQKVAALIAAPPATTPAPAPAAVAETAPSTVATTSTTTTTLAAPVKPVPPPYGGTSGTNPHHGDPFLTCVRTRESGGNYGVVNPAGPYLGAYQFLQATWNATANHMGRPELVGVPANTATPYDQDDVAWALYQWQGAAPWGGRCP
jgi:hypothetical protein